MSKGCLFWADYVFVLDSGHYQYEVLFCVDIGGLVYVHCVVLVAMYRSTCLNAARRVVYGHRLPNIMTYGQYHTLRIKVLFCIDIDDLM